MQNRYNVPDLTPSEMESLTMLRELLSSLLDPESPPVPGSREAALHNDDGTLLRYIQGRPTLEDAAQMFREAMKWREVRKGGGGGWTTTQCWSWSEQTSTADT